jgi:aerobic-type carbon monoxide dehydrogenase small subunit (CoxS/CutS family)
MIDIALTVNGARHSVKVPPETTLLTLLREHLGLTGAKAGCEVGDCGACTVLVDGRAVNGCLMLALQAHGREVVTIEGLATREALHPLQLAFEERGALQCGFCGPGVILSAKALLDDNPAPTARDIREALAGNLCRCTGYAKMIEAVQEAARGMQDRAVHGGSSS